MFFRNIWGILIVFVLLYPFSVAGITVEESLQNTIQELPISAEQKSALHSAFLDGFRPSLERNIPDAQSGSIKRIISAALFEEFPYDKIAEKTYLVYLAEAQGSPVKSTEKIMCEIGFGYPISLNILIATSSTLAKFEQSNISEEIYAEFLYHSIDRDWNSKVTTKVSEAIIEAFDRGIDPEKVTLAMILAVDKRYKEGVDIRALIENVLSTVKKYKKAKASYGMQNAIEKGVPRKIVDEIHNRAVSQKWDDNLTLAVLEGLIEGKERYLSLEKLVLAFFMKIEKGVKTAPRVMVNRVIKHMMEVEKSRLKRVREKIFGKMNRDRFMQLVRGWLGTPYRWGGTTKRGIDCSAFVRDVYRDIGINLPRVSYHQCYVGVSVPVEELKFGDLIYFDMKGIGKVGHVGIYLDDGRFVHSCLSKGVAICDFKDYYRFRIVEVRRVAV